MSRPVHIEALVCPACKGRLRSKNNAEALECQACQLAYPIEGGIPVMLIEKASPIS